MPQYQDVKLEDLQPLRILFGFFPTYRQVTFFTAHDFHCATSQLCPPRLCRFSGEVHCWAVWAACGLRDVCLGALQSPLKPAWNRVLQVGDASGIQSPLSFGGFGAMTRHLERLRQAVTEALEVSPWSQPLF